MSDLKTKIFNFFPISKSKGSVPYDKAILEFLDQPVLIDDVDTTITSFLKTYGSPVHIDPDDFEDGDDKDLDEVDDVEDDSLDDVVLPSSKVEPSEPEPSEPEPSEPEPSEPVSE